MDSNTTKLLRECNAGIKMGENALNLVMEYVKNKELRDVLDEAKDAHAILGDETHRMLIRARETTKPPHKLAEKMSEMKIKVALSMNGSAASAAGLITDGCNMGAKSISHYLNKYPTVEMNARHLAHRIIAIEDELRDKLRAYL